jgi:endonuclease-3
MQKKNLDTIFQTFEKRYPDPTTELNWKTPFQLIVAVILSAQSTDKHINKVTEVLFEKVSHPQDVVALGYEAFHALLISVNYHNNKAKNIFKLSQQLSVLEWNTDHVKTTEVKAKQIFDTFGYFIPSDWEQLRLLA